LKLAFAAVTLLGIAFGGVSSSGQEIQVFGFTAEWKYEPSGTNPPSNWMSLDYDDSYWPAGQGAFSTFSTENLLGLAPINSGAEIYNPYPIPGNVPSHYYRSRFSFRYPTTNVTLVASNLIDDGAVIYLNGIELARIAMPTGAVDHTTVATRDNEVSSRGTEIIRFAPPPHLQEENLLAVEVHQGSPFSTDTVFAMSLSARFPLAINILSQPESQALWENSNVVFRVEATGFPMFQQWQQDGTNIPGATASTYSIPRVSARHEGAYRVVITNEYESVTSRVAILTVFTDREGPRLLAAVGNNIPAGGGSPFGSNTINILLDEQVSATSARNANNYTLTRLGTTNSISILNALYSTALGVLLNVDAADPDWTPGGDYVLTVNNVADSQGNAIAPGSQIAVAWGRTTNLIAPDAVWDFHASAVFEPEVFDEGWFACDYAPSFWWAQGQGLFFGGVIAAEPCLSLGTLQTQTGYQPEPALYRTSFQWPADWPSSGILRIATAYDDGLVLYLDGKEIHRNNAGAAGSAIGLATKAPGSLSVCVTNLSVTVSNLNPGFHCLAAAVLQPNTPTSADSVFALRMDGTAYLTPALPEQPPPVLALTPLDMNSARLSWTGGGYALESATNLNLGTASYPFGPWQPVPNMSNPYTIGLDEMQRFFRLKK
jgi:hypothetical protein